MELTPGQESLTKAVIGMAMKVHSTLGSGFVEFVYRNALVYELRKASFAVDIEKPLRVYYEGVVVGEFSTDLIVNDWLIVELKAVSALAPHHEVQVVNYLTALQKDIGLLLNFGAQSLQFQRKHRRLIPRSKTPLNLHE